MEEGFRTFVSRTKSAAEDIVTRENLGADVKSVMQDLIQVCEASESAQSEVVGQSAEVRIQKKRTEQAKAETKAAEKRVETLKGFAAELIDAIKAINHEAAAITDAEASTKIRASVQKIAETIREISKV